jgi:CDP-glucose 4,6-dehydratase
MTASEEETMPDPTWRARRVLVTGATGIVGSWVVKALVAEGAHTIGLIRDADPQSELYRSGDSERITVVSGCLEDFNTLERAISDHDVDSVIHLGAQAIVGVGQRSPLRTFESNIRGTYNLLEACRIHAGLVRRIVVASSDKAYGAQPNLPYTEDMPLDGRFPYEVSKSCADLIARAYHETYGLPVAIARCGNVYGGGDLNWSRIVPETVRALHRRERPVIRSDGTYVRDYIYVEDVARAYLCLADQAARADVGGQGFNFSTESPLTVLEVVAAVRRVMDCEDIEPIIEATAVGEIRSQYLSAAREHTVLGWRPSFALDEGLRATVDWYRAFLG